ncbi:tRNA dimethylallyltransferase [Sporothrix brasiliensis 5110]|uniref:tRNA dimethylallyltransferase n=1 Tax=Sporothrix brasiliensis 5110 TaxID=1398154 RepID=A0A0C2ENX6_9PEZI|nr:tRNA dimethylallyltransferase [Sporothrix brasiliensis 5110]KIH87844.1 tRNA dimethylallyltransferase [Sporothrix brasiliensis 5110]
MTRPTEPLVAVLGSTGTGKSDLAVELASRFNGEIINVDAMQMYRGLPVTTNKISVEEQRGVPHHLLGTIGLHEPTWHVDRFKREASQIIQEIRRRGRLPIVVGGSQYYTDGLLFEDHLVESASGGEDGDGAAGEDPTLTENGNDEVLVDNSIQYPILNEPTETLLAELTKVDPVMAARWHPNDRRKIRRSLEIFLTTGRRASDIYAEQRKRREERERERKEATAAAAEGKPWQTLLLWVYAKPDILNARLDARIDTMIERGLEQEANQMYDTLQESAARGVPVDRTRGIWQSIGYKEMEPYVVAQRAQNNHEAATPSDAGAAGDSVETTAGQAAAPDIAKLRETGLDGIKFGTRRYARYQLRWIKHKTIPYLADVGALDHLYLLDSTDKAAWQTNVAETGVRLAEAFLAGDAGALPAPVDVSETAREVLTMTIAASRGTLNDAPEKMAAQQHTCAICHVTLQTEDQWNRHLRSSRHRRVLQKQKRRALVPAPNVPVPVIIDEAVPAEGATGPVETPDETASLVDKSPVPQQS